MCALDESSAGIIRIKDDFVQKQQSNLKFNKRKEKSILKEKENGSGREDKWGAKESKLSIP